MMFRTSPGKAKKPHAGRGVHVSSRLGGCVIGHAFSQMG